MKNASLILAFTLLASGSVFADDQTAAPSAEAQTKLKVEDAKEKKNTVSGDIDEEITNAKLRAESGSKSKWSASVSANYNGSSLEKPLDRNRANPDHVPVPPRVTLSGSVEARYRMDKNQSITAGTGFLLETPLQKADHGDVSTPYVSYNYVGKVAQIQNVASAQLAFATADDDIKVGTYGTGTLVDILAYDFGGSRLTVGLVAEGDYTLYKNNKDQIVRLHGSSKSRAAGDYQEDYDLVLDPTMEFAISDSVQLRTVFRTWTYSHSVFADGFTFEKKPWTQSFGVGWAVTRDIYLYPNFQWDWEQWRSKDFSFANKEVRANTTVALSATLNVF
jgi:hypothetical protein